MVPEAPLEQKEGGLVPRGEGWFVVNAREARWRSADGRGAQVSFDGWPDGYFPQVGIALFVLGPGEPIGMYHWEADQEDFLVLSGEALLLVEGEERPLRAWDFVHCPAGADHTIVGAGSGPAVIVATGARGRRSPRRERRARDDRPAGGLRAVPGSAPGYLPRGLAPVTGVPEAPL